MLALLQTDHVISYSNSTTRWARVHRHQLPFPSLEEGFTSQRRLSLTRPIRAHIAIVPTDLLQSTNLLGIRTNNEHAIQSGPSHLQTECNFKVQAIGYTLFCIHGPSLPTIELRTNPPCQCPDCAAPLGQTPSGTCRPLDFSTLHVSTPCECRNSKLNRGMWVDDNLIMALAGSLSNGKDVGGKEEYAPSLDISISLDNHPDRAGLR